MSVYNTDRMNKEELAMGMEQYKLETHPKSNPAAIIQGEKYRIKLVGTHNIPPRHAFVIQNKMPMGEIDTRLLKLYSEEPLLMSEVVKDDAELLFLDTWLTELFSKLE